MTAAELGVVGAVAVVSALPTGAAPAAGRPRGAGGLPPAAPRGIARPRPGLRGGGGPGAALDTDKDLLLPLVPRRPFYRACLYPRHDCGRVLLALGATPDHSTSTENDWKGNGKCTCPGDIARR